MVHNRVTYLVGAVRVGGIRLATLGILYTYMYVSEIQVTCIHVLFHLPFVCDNNVHVTTLSYQLPQSDLLFPKGKKVMLADSLYYFVIYMIINILQ